MALCLQVTPRRSWIKDEIGGLETAISEMRMSRPVFSEGRLTLRCVAEIYNLYHRVTNITVRLNDHEVSPWPPASVRHSDTQGLSGQGEPKKNT
jgi:hypothetical protein